MILFALVLFTITTLCHDLRAAELTVGEYEKNIESRYGIVIVDDTAPCGCQVNGKPQGEELRAILEKIDAFYKNLPDKMLQRVIEYHQSAGPLYIFLDTGVGGYGGYFVGGGHHDLSINLDISSPEYMLGWNYATNFIMPRYRPDFDSYSTDETEIINAVMENCVPSFYWQARNLVGDAYLNQDDAGKPLYDYDRVMSLLSIIKEETKKQIDRGEFGRFDVVPPENYTKAREELNSTIARAYNRLENRLINIIAQIHENPNSVREFLNNVPDSEYNKLVEFAYHIMKSNEYYKDGMDHYPIFADNYVFQTPLFSNVEKAMKNTVQIMIDGALIEFEAYNILGNNYFKLRDVASVLSNSEAKFNVLWNEKTSLISLVKGMDYEAVGGEMTVSRGNVIETVNRRLAKIELAGNEYKLAAYHIYNNNFFKLRDLALYLGFSVEWDEENKMIVIKTDLT